MTFMKNFVLTLFALYGIGASAVSFYGMFFLDLPALDQAVATNAENAELRHRLNVSAEGNWILLGNLITVVAISGMSRRHGKKDDQV
jgi:hypothetical protein